MFLHSFIPNSLLFSMPVLLLFIPLHLLFSYTTFVTFICITRTYWHIRLICKSRTQAHIQTLTYTYLQNYVTYTQKPIFMTTVCISIIIDLTLVRLTCLSSFPGNDLVYRVSTVWSCLAKHNYPFCFFNFWPLEIMNVVSLVEPLSPPGHTEISLGDSARGLQSV